MTGTPREPASFEKANVEVIRRRDGLALLALAPLVLFQSVWMLTGGVPFPFPGSYGLVLVPALLLLSVPMLLAGIRLRRPTGHVAASEAGLVLDGRLVRPRSTIHSAFVRHLSDGRPSVRVERRFGLFPLDLVVADEAEGDRLLRALGRDPARATATFRALETRRSFLRRFLLFAPSFGLAFGAIAFLVFYHLVVGHHPPPLPRPVPLVLIFFMALYPSVMMVREGRFTVGADGVLIRGRDFVSYADIESASMQGLELVLALRSGKTRRFYVGGKHPGAVKALAHEQTGDALLRRLEEAREAYVRGTRTHASSLVARGARTPHEWLTALRRIADPDGAAYRRPALPPEQLWRIVEDAQCTPEQRAGAAVALPRGLDDASKARLRVAAESCASPALRETLEAVEAEQPDEEVEKALRRIG